MSDAKEKLLLIGYRAYGDFLYALPVIGKLLIGYDVHFELNGKGYELFHDDPRFSGITFFDMDTWMRKEPRPELAEIVKARLAKLEEELKPDKVINLIDTLETECIAGSHMPIFHAPVEERRALFGKKNFYDAVLKKCGFDENVDNIGGLYFSEQQIAWGKGWRAGQQNDFVIVMPLAGSCCHKVYPDMPRLCYDILETYPNAVIYLTGDESVAHAQWAHPRIKHTCGKIPFKQALMMAKHADYVFGGETGILVGAGMWGTPKTMLCTASSIYQTVKYHDNDYSMQAGVKCSPCHRAVYTTADCENMIADGEDIYPACIKSFDYEDILDTVRKVYDNRNIYNKEYYERYVERALTPLGSELYQSRWETIERYCHGNMRLLDYGCASGAFHKSSRNGFNATGFDVNPYSEFKTLPDEKIDILTMWDVIEHLKDPKEILSSLTPEWVFISTPNKDAHHGDLETWKHYRPDEHLHHFNLGTLSDLFGKCGYKILESNYDEGSIRDPRDPRQILTVVARRI